MTRTLRHTVRTLAALLMLSGTTAHARQGFTALMPADSVDTTVPQNAPNAIDEVVWVVGDEPILRSDIEVMRLQAETEGMKFNGDPDCSIPEQLAVQKLFLHQAAIDSIEVTESDISQELDERVNYLVAQIGSREKVEEYYKKSLTKLRQEWHDDLKNQLLTQRMRQELVKDVSVTPADVRNHFKDLPQDSIPYVPTTVEVQIITMEPKVPQEELNRVKNELRNYTERINSGETSFATLARLYSEDGSARQGGELGFMPRSSLDPTFASVAFNLTDPKKISKIVETEFGFHIIQLIDKRGDRINVRHILMKPRISQQEIDEAKHKLDSLRNDLNANKFSFDEAATYVSDDKDTKNNHGLMAAVDQETGMRTSKFRMQDLPTEVARAVESLQIGDVSEPFQMINNKGKTVCAIVRLKNRTEAHRATITEDFQTMKNVVMAKRREQLLHDWVAEKLKNTYVRLNEQYKDCKFEYEGWVKP